MSRSTNGEVSVPLQTVDEASSVVARGASAPALRILIAALPAPLTEAVTHQLTAAGMGHPIAADVKSIDAVCERIQAMDADLVLVELREEDEASAASVIRSLHAARRDLFVVGLVDDWIEIETPPEPDRTIMVNPDDLSSFVMWETIRDLIHVIRSRPAPEPSRPLAAGESRDFRRIVEASSDGQIVLDEQDGVVFQNPAAAELVDVDDIITLVGSVSGVSDGTLVELTLQSGHPVEAVVVSTTWDGAPVRLVTLHDRSRQKDAEAELRRLNTHLREMAHTDALTCVLNRRGLESVLVTQSHDAIAVMFDLDNFKEINESFGHAIGDAVLKSVGSTLRELSRPTDFVCRIGGDEFLLLLSNTDVEEGIRLAEQMRLAIAACPIMADSQPIHPTVTVGVAPVQRSVRTVADILTSTRMTLAAGKAGGKNRVGVTDQEQAINTIVQQLYRGDGLTVVAQSIVNLTTNRVVGYELLSRGPRGVSAMPREFFRLCVEHGILHEVDLACLRNGVLRARKLDPRLNFHLNLFPSTLNRTPVDEILRILSDSDGRRYCIELTERQMVVDSQTLRDRLRVLQSAGVCVAIDDVGAGSSSLESLLTLRPDVAKIDRKVVQGVVDDPDRRRALKKLVDVIRVLESEPVAEGVESEEDARFLRDIGVQYAQGYLWGLPE